MCCRSDSVHLKGLVQCFQMRPRNKERRGGRSDEESEKNEKNCKKETKNEKVAKGPIVDHLGLVHTQTVSQAGSWLSLSQTRTRT